jgi:2-polyprenyl-6-methoxyphenol hydroxylase-like FAD-dependent oxidoreductase
LKNVPGEDERMLKRITIVGGGLAGLTLGIGLRQQSVPVTIRARK